MNTSKSMDVDDIMDMVTELRRDVDRLDKVVQKYLVSEITGEGYVTPTNPRRFKPPTIEEIAHRMKERGITAFTAQTFHAYYKSVGWRIGNKPMKDWDSALTTWEGREHATPKIAPNKFIKFYTYNDICLMAQTNDNVWQEYVSLQLPDRPRPVWAHVNDASSNNLMQYKI